MTNQEAIKTLRKLWRETKYSWYEEVYNKAISALQAQDNSDTNVGDFVSKKAVELALLEKGQASKRYKLGEIWELNFDEIREALATVPPTESEQRWIPVTERLPKQYGNYLVFIEGEEPDIGTINPNDPRGWSLCDANGFYWASDKMLNVIAWMPLPEPYKEEKK